MRKEATTRRACSKALWLSSQLSQLLRLVLLICCGVPAYGQQIITPGLIIRSANQVGDTLESLGASSLDNREAVRGYQQLLLAGTLKATSARLSEAYSTWPNWLVGDPDLRLSHSKHSSDYPPRYKLSMYILSVVPFTGLHFIFAFLPPSPLTLSWFAILKTLP
jgi:hypothetical protein